MMKNQPQSSRLSHPENSRRISNDHRGVSPSRSYVASHISNRSSNLDHATTIHNNGESRRLIVPETTRPVPRPTAWGDVMGVNPVLNSVYRPSSLVQKERVPIGTPPSPTRVPTTTTVQKKSQSELQIIMQEQEEEQMLHKLIEDDRKAELLAEQMQEEEFMRLAMEMSLSESMHFSHSVLVDDADLMNDSPSHTVSIENSQKQGSPYDKELAQRNQHQPTSSSSLIVPNLSPTRPRSSSLQLQSTMTTVVEEEFPIDGKKVVLGMARRFLQEEEVRVIQEALHRNSVHENIHTDKEIKKAFPIEDKKHSEEGTFQKMSHVVPHGQNIPTTPIKTFHVERIKINSPATARSVPTSPSSTRSQPNSPKVASPHATTEDRFIRSRFASARQQNEPEMSQADRLAIQQALSGQNDVVVTQHLPVSDEEAATVMEALRIADEMEERKSLHLAMQLHREQLGSSDRNRTVPIKNQGNVRTMTQADILKEQGVIRSSIVKHRSNSMNQDEYLDDGDHRLVGFRMNQNNVNNGPDDGHWRRRDQNMVMGPNQEVRTKHDSDLNGITNVHRLGLEHDEFPAVGNKAFNSFMQSVKKTKKGVTDTQRTSRASSDTDTTTTENAMDPRFRTQNSKTNNNEQIE